MTNEDSTTTPEESPVGGEYYEETVVEYVDNTRRRRILAILLLLLAFLLAGSTYLFIRITKPAGVPAATSLPSGMSWIRSVYGWGPGPNQQITSPTAVAVAPNGIIWSLANHIYIIGVTPAGKVVRIIQPKLGLTGSLEGIAVGDDGTIWVTDYGNNKVYAFSPAGQLLRSVDVQLPQVVAVKGDRVAVAGSYGVALFDTQGNLLSKWGSGGSGPNQFSFPHGILIGADNNIYVADTQNLRVSAFDQRGKLLWTKANSQKVGASLQAIQGTATIVNGVNQGLLLPTGLAQDSNGRLLVTDAFNFDIAVLDPTHKGLVVARYGEEGGDDGQFAYPTGIAYDPNRNTVVVADTSNNRLQIIRLPGTGGSIIGRAFTSITDTPLWLCIFPFLLLLIAVILFVIQRRRQREEPEEEDEPDAGETPVMPFTEEPAK